MIERLRAARVIAVLRTPDGDSAVRAEQALVAGGVQAIELTFTTPGAAGAIAVKLFPASAVGPSYLRAPRGPYPEVQVVPTGGIGPRDVRAWLDAGGELCPQIVAEGRWDELSATAERYLAA